ncbi:MAG: hypothetical protein BroJett006_23130 [Betaproteobacteria bacterium]|nr:MAG: hypothetical protein BroJett006_23130 [Betaproteobacteria bacterium]
MDVAGQLGIIGEDGVVADLAVMGQMHIGHDPVVRSKPGYSDVLRGTAVERAEFADGIAITNLKLCRLSGVFFILGHLPDRAILKNPIAIPDAGVSVEDNMRSNPGVVADLDVFSDDRISANCNIAA